VVHGVAPCSHQCAVLGLPLAELLLATPIIADIWAGVMQCVSQPRCGYGTKLLHYLEAMLAINSRHLGHMLATALALQAGDASRDGAAVQDTPLESMRLLSVESAQHFYERGGYSPPDGCREMSKPLEQLTPLLRI